MATIEWRDVKDDEAKMAGLMRKEGKIARNLLWSLRSPKPSQENRVGGKAVALSRATEFFGATFFRFTMASDKFSLQSKLSRKALRKGWHPASPVGGEKQGTHPCHRATRTYAVAGPFLPIHSNRCHLRTGLAFARPWGSLRSFPSIDADDPYNFSRLAKSSSPLRLWLGIHFELATPIGPPEPSDIWKQSTSFWAATVI
jgi:hypothetical protein